MAVLLASPSCWRDRRSLVSVIGSTSVHPFAEMLAEEFNGRQAEIRVEVQGGGSTAGLQAVANGVADIGMSSRGLKDDEKFGTVTIARDGIAVVVHLSNPVGELSSDQVRDIFAGRIANWKAVGGNDRQIRVITREEGSGTREAFSHLVMGGQRICRGALTQESNGAVRELVRSDPCAIGYMSLGVVGPELKKLKVDGVEPSRETVTSGKYRLVRPFLFVYRGRRPSPRVQKFIDFVRSDEAQQMLEREGLVKAE